MTKFFWILARLKDGYTVFLQTYGGHVAKIVPSRLKTIDQLLKYRGEKLFMRHGKKWIDYSYTKVSARK